MRCEDEMNLEEFLEALENCPDEDLREKYNLWSNYEIYMEIHYKRLIENLEKTGKYEPHIHGENHDLVWHEGNITIQIEKNENPGEPEVMKELLNMPDEIYNHYLRIRRYKTVVRLHSHSIKKDYERDTLRSMANVIKDLAEYVKANNIDSCFTELDFNDLDKLKKMTYYPDNSRK
ncbi:MAG: hypothetical protein ABIH72_01420 [archaeon]